MDPKWQRARVIGALSDQSLIGRKIWLRAEVPANEVGLRESDHKLIEGKNAVHTQIIVDGQPSLACMKFFELLPEFADDVPLIPYEQWLKESDTEKGANQ